MVVAFRAASTLDDANVADTTLTKPTGTVDNDILIAVLKTDDNVAVTAPAGWTLLRNTDSPGQLTDQDAYWKRASGEGASWTWTHAAAFRSGCVIALSGAVTTGDPFDGSKITDNTGVGTAVTVLSITLTETDSLILCISTSWDYVTATGPGGTPTFTERVDNAQCHAVYTASATASGAVGNKTITLSSSTDWMSLMLAVRSQVTAPAGRKPLLTLLRAG